MTGSTPARIAFLDDDHVLAVMRDLLTDDIAAVTAFFAPELPDLEVLRAVRDKLSGVTVTAAPTEATVLITRRAPVPRAVLEASPQARLVQRLGLRADGIDLEAARERGVVVSCLARPSLVRTAEHALLLMLALTKRLPAAQNAMRSASKNEPTPAGVAYNWAGLTGIGGLAGATLGIVGLGEVGRLVAERAVALGMCVSYTSRSRLSASTEEALGLAYRSLPVLLAEADIVTLHTPGVAAGRPVIGRAELAVMRPGALLVNTSRGRLVDEDALFDALAAGRLGGAGLDVHRIEPRPADDRFHALDNVILTPHVAGGSRLDMITEIGRLFDDIGLVLAGRQPAYGHPLNQRHLASTP